MAFRAITSCRFTATGGEALEVFKQFRPHVTLVDLRLPDLSGTDIIRAIQTQCSDCQVVVLTTYDGDEDIYLALEAGARAYLLKDARRDELLAPNPSGACGPTVYPSRNCAAADGSFRLHRTHGP
jgi:DNA-binding NarL/FixJ family response regulator